jgi:hypothetical protein
MGDASASSGYYFFSSLKLTGGSFRHMILDRLGNLLYFQPLTSVGSDFKLHQNGKMTYVFSPGANPNAGRFRVMDSTFYVVDSLQCKNGIFTDTHDIIFLPNGHYLMLGYEFRTMNLSSYNWFNGNGSPGSSNANVKCGVIQELDENKNVVFSWKAADHYQFSDVEQQWLFSPINVDWTHFNSVEQDTDGNILISLRHFSEITKINRQTGAIMWRFGGKRNQFTFINDPYSSFIGQHDARRISNGNVTLFDNGFRQQFIHPARALEYALNTQNMTATLVWSHIYASNASSRFMGGMQRLASGNTVIGWGSLVNANVTFNMVKPNNSLVMELRFPDSLITYRAYNFPNLPFNMNRPVVRCFDSTAGSYLDAGAGHSSYLWSSGATTRIIPVTSPGTYYVFVPYGQGGFISSERTVITSMNNPCENVSIGEPVSEIPGKFELMQNYPNPFNPGTNFEYRIASFGPVSLKVYNATGEEAAVLVNEQQVPGVYYVNWNASAYPSGVYYYKLEAGSFTQTRKMVLLK